MLLGALFLLPRAGVAALAGLFVALGAHEWALLCRLGRAAGWIYAVVAAAGMVALVAASDRAALGAFAIAAAFWLLAIPLWLWQGVQSRHRGALIVSGFVVLVPAGVALSLLPPLQVLAVLVLVWIADSAAYFVGRRYGRRKLAPSISPGKTWEGAAGGLAGALVYAIICAAFVGRIAWAPLLGGAALLAAISIVGDLFESAAKRQAGVKDSGALLPGHGGILDRIDSATAVLPLAALLLSWMRANG